MLKTHPVSKNRRRAASLCPQSSHWRLEFPFFKNWKLQNQSLNISATSPISAYQHISIISSSIYRYYMLHPAPGADRAASLIQRPKLIEDFHHHILEPWDETSNLMRRSHVPRWLWLIMSCSSRPAFKIGSKTSSEREGGSAAQCNLPHPDSKERHTLQNHLFSLRRIFCSALFILLERERVKGLWTGWQSFITGVSGEEWDHSTHLAWKLWKREICWIVVRDA